MILVSRSPSAFIRLSYAHCLAGGWPWRSYDQIWNPVSGVPERAGADFRWRPTRSRTLLRSVLDRGLDAAVVLLISTVQAFGVALQEDLHAVACSLGYLGGAYASVKPCRQGCMPEVVGPARER